MQAYSNSDDSAGSRIKQRHCLNSARIIPRWGSNLYLSLYLPPSLSLPPYFEYAGAPKIQPLIADGTGLRTHYPPALMPEVQARHPVVANPWNRIIRRPIESGFPSRPASCQFRELQARVYDTPIERVHGVYVYKARWWISRNANWLKGLCRCRVCIDRLVTARWMTRAGGGGGWRRYAPD